MIKHIHQGFLLQCDYKAVKLAGLSVPWGEVSWCPSWREPRELLDGNGPLVRKVSLAMLRRGLSTQEEWDELMARLKGISMIILVLIQLLMHYGGSNPSAIELAISN